MAREEAWGQTLVFGFSSLFCIGFKKHLKTTLGAGRVYECERQAYGDSRWAFERPLFQGRRQRGRDGRDSYILDFKSIWLLPKACLGG